ncbi:MAG: hypothetical protein HYY24_11975 [Verrucomicrobia bacterium]|nr:hypothetical protein [Verrucomicrobiota bacterium]
MNTLPTSFTHDGFTFDLVMRDGDVALFEKMKPHFSRPSYEVVIVQRSRDRTIAGKFIPAAEHMPSSESWGQLGWTYSDREAARKKFFELCDPVPEACSLPCAKPAGAFSRAGSVSTAAPCSPAVTSNLP